MKAKIYNNTLACKKYYDKNKNNPEFRQRKAMNTRRCKLRKETPMCWRIFQGWKKYLFGLNVRNKLIEHLRVKIDRILLKVMIDSWKNYERTPKPNIVRNPIVCTFF